MLRAVEEVAEVECGHIAVAILVNLVPGLVDPSLSVGIGLAADLEEELIEVDGTVFVGVEHV